MQTQAVTTEQVEERTTGMILADLTLATGALIAASREEKELFEAHKASLRHRQLCQDEKWRLEQELEKAMVAESGVSV